MGQYHYTVNLDKHEFIHPHKLGDGLKLLEQCGGPPGGTNDALHLLLSVSSGRGGGDFHTGSSLIGRWGGDRIAVVGDYAEPGDLASEHIAETIYSRCGSEAGHNGPRFRDITDELLPVLEAEYEVVIGGSGVAQRVRLSDAFTGWEYSHMRHERVARINGKDYPLAALVHEAHRQMAYGIRAPFGLGLMTDGAV